MRSVLGRVFRYAIHTDRLRDNPVGELRSAIAAPIVTHIAAISKAADAGALMRSIESYQGHAVTAFRDNDREHHENLTDEQLGRGHVGAPP